MEATAAPVATMADMINTALRVGFHLRYSPAQSNRSLHASIACPLSTLLGFSHYVVRTLALRVESLVGAALRHVMRDLACYGPCGHPVSVCALIAPSLGSYELGITTWSGSRCA